MYTCRLVRATTLVAALASGVLVHPAAAQNKYSACPSADEYRRCGVVPKLTPRAALDLLHLLDSEPESKYDRVLRIYFDTLYSKNFADWVVFIGRDTVKQALFVNGEFSKDNDVQGQTALSVVVFSETDLKVPGEAPPDSAHLATRDSARGLGLRLMMRQCEKARATCTVELSSSGDDPAPSGAGESGGASAVKAALVLSRTTLQYAGDPTVTALLKGIGKEFLGGGTSATTAVPDSVFSITLTDVVRHDDNTGPATHLYVGMTRAALPANALTRFTMRPDQSTGTDIPSVSSVSRSIENANGSLFSASLAFGVTFNAADTTLKVNTDSSGTDIDSVSFNLKPNAWLLLHFNPLRPRLPLNRLSAGLVVGTNIGVSDLFHDFVLGVGADRLLWGEVGLAAGVNFMLHRHSSAITNASGKVTGLRSDESRSFKAHNWFVGLSLPL